MATNAELNKTTTEQQEEIDALKADVAALKEAVAAQAEAAPEMTEEAPAASGGTIDLEIEPETDGTETPKVFTTLRFNGVLYRVA